MSFRIEPQMFQSFLSAISYCYTIHPLFSVGGDDTELEYQEARLIEGLLGRWLETGYCSQSQHGTIFKRNTSFTSKSTEKQLESLLTSLEETQKKK